jgi:hypothetical protein
VFADQLADNEKGNENHCERKTALDENARKPIVILAFLQKRADGKPIGMSTRLEVAACAKRINRSVPTVWRWIRAGCRIDDPQSVEAFQIEMERRKTTITRSRERRGIARNSSPGP